MAVINQIFSTINSVNKQTWGENALQLTDLQSSIAFGNFLRNDASAESLEIWMGKLSNVIGKTIIRNNREVTEDDLNIEVDDMAWGGIMRTIRIVPISVEHNTEYDIENGATIDPFKVKAPKAIQKLFSKFGTFQGLVTILDKQLFTAFDTEAGLMAFYDAVYQQLVNIMKVAKKNYDRMAIANFIGEKFKLQTEQPNKLHTIDVGKLYRTETGKTLDRTQALEGTDPDFVRYLSKKIPQIKKEMASYTAVFNATTGDELVPQQTPAEYLKFYILNNLESGFNSYLYSTTYHDEMVKIDTYKSVPFWQGIGNVAPFDAANTSKIHINVASDGTEIEQDGIIAVMFDKEAVSSNYREEKAESVRIPTKGINHIKYVTYMYCNDAFSNGVVLYVGNTDGVDDEV